MENPRPRYAASLRGSTRAMSPRPLPTDHDDAVSTREYQRDQPSQQPTRPPSMLRALEAPTMRTTRNALMNNGADAANELI